MRRSPRRVAREPSPESPSFSEPSEEIGLPDRVTADHSRSEAGRIARDAQVDRRLQDPVELEAPIELAPRTVEIARGRILLPGDHGVDTALQVGVDDDDEVPGLHEA